MARETDKTGKTARKTGGSFDLSKPDSSLVPAADARRLRNLSREQEKKRNRKRRIVTVVFLVCLATGVIILTGDYMRRQRSGFVSRSLARLLNGMDNAPEEETDPAGNVYEPMQDSDKKNASSVGLGGGIEAIRQINPDFVGWLRVHCLYRIDLPVFQRDNEYYLTHDTAGAVSEEGSAFVDADCILNPRDDNVIVYAHNCASGEMFGTLYQMANPEYLSQDPFVTFGVLDENGEYSENEYVPFAVLRTTVGYQEDEFDFLVRSFPDEESFRFFCDSAERRSLIRDVVGCDRNDRFLTLVTCSDRTRESRLVVLLRRIRNDEDASQLKERFLI